MYEFEHITESLLLRSFGSQVPAAAGEWKETPLMDGLERLFREIGAYLEFVNIARGR